jgi:hypothetical protein
LDAISAQRKQLIAAGRTSSDAIIASGENGQIPVALNACSQLLIVAVRPMHQQSPKRGDISQLPRRSIAIVL